MAFLAPLLAPSPAAAAPRPVVSCWATVIAPDQVRVTWTSATNDEADRYAIYRSRDGRPYFWKGTASRQDRSFINTALPVGSFRYRVVTISASNERRATDCGPSGAVNIGPAAPAPAPTQTVRPVASCWATFNNDGRIRISWTRAPGDNAQRFAIHRSRNGGQFFWAGMATAPATQFLNNRPANGTYRYRVETVSPTGLRAARNCGPDGGINVGSPTVNPSPAPRTIMAIGDSITHGRSDRPSWRYPFQTRAANVRCAIDMVGTETRWVDGPPTANYAGFDHDHQSFGGRSTRQAADSAIPAARTLRPRIALIHTGTNDVLSGTLPADAGRELRRLIDGLRSARSDVIIYVAEIIPAGPARATETARWNAEIRAIAANKNRLGSPVRTVDMFSGWNYSTMTVSYDNIHPNFAGSDFIARRWMDRLRNDRIC